MELLMMSGGGSTDTDALTAASGDVLEGKTYLGSGDDETKTGTMIDRSRHYDSEEKLSAGDAKIQISKETRYITDSTGQSRVLMLPPQGAYPEKGVYISESTARLGIDPSKIASLQSIGGVKGTFTDDANAGAEDIRMGKRAYVKGTLVEGEASDYGSIYKELGAGEVYQVSKGYYSGGKVVAKDLKSQTPANVDAGHMITGYTGYANGEKVSGAIPDLGAYQYAGGIGEAGDYYAFKDAPNGWYHEDSSNAEWAPELRLAKTTVRNYLGVAANKIISGQVIAGIWGNQHTYAYAHGSVASDSGRFMYDSTSYYYCRLNIGFEPILAVFCYYAPSRYRDVTVCTIDPSGSIAFRMVNFNQARMGGLYSYGFNNGEHGTYFGKGNLLIPVAYGGAAYQYWIVGYN
jgi:hypothetical protein